MRERELKLAVGDTFVVPPLEGDEAGIAQVAALPELELGSVYHDTADLRLARHGVTLRYRVGEAGGPRWTLKLPVAYGDGIERDEIDLEGGPGRIPQAARDLVTAWVRHEVLVPAAAMSTRRRRWLLSDERGAAVAELAQDDVSVLDGERVVARFRELELESRGPELERLLPIARELQRAGAVPAPPVPKAVRALGPRATAAPDVVEVIPGPGSSAADAVRGAIATAVLRLQRYDAAARLHDDEAIHQMRVATRRLRSDLRTFRELLDQDWATRLSEELRWLGSVLGAVRDRDVELELLDDLAADLPGIEPLAGALQERRELAHRELATAVTDVRYLDLLDRLVDASRAPMLAGSHDRRARKVLPRLVRRRSRRLLRDAAAISLDADPADLHRVRIRAKRTRYAAEAAAPFLGRAARSCARVARRAEAMQELLGMLQDSTILERDARDVLRLREGDAAFAFAAGQLVGRLESVEADVRGSYDELLWRLARAVRAFKRR